MSDSTDGADRMHAMGVTVTREEGTVDLEFYETPEDTAAGDVDLVVSMPEFLAENLSMGVQETIHGRYDE